MNKYLIIGRALEAANSLAGEVDEILVDYCTGADLRDPWIWKTLRKEGIALENQEGLDYKDASPYVPEWNFMIFICKDDENHITVKVRYVD